MKKISKYKKLYKDSIIFAIGNFGSKILSLILVPLYVRYLSTSEYGTIDIIITTTNIILPIMSFSIYEGALRFLFDKSLSKKRIVSTSLNISFLGIIVVFIIGFFLDNFIEKNFVFYSLFLVSFQSIQTLFAQIVRSLGDTKLYAINGIIYTFVMGLLNIVFLMNFHLGISGYFYALIITNICSIIFLLSFSKITSFIDVKVVDLSLAKEMLMYSIPLIPNALMWWIMNGVSRYSILYFWNAETNGLFAVANKLPSLVTLVTTIFFQAWQLFAIDMYERNDDDEIYNTVFNYFSSLLFLVASVLLGLLIPVMKIFISNDFFSAWVFTPPLILAAVLSSFANFFAIIYNTSKKTKGIFKTSMIAGVVNILMSITLIPFLGAFGAGVSSVVGFFIMWILRIRDSHDLIKLKINWNLLSKNFILIFFQMIFLYILEKENTLNLVQFIFVLLEIYINRDLFSILKKKGKI